MTRQRGFTLVEALVALAIMSVTLVALYGAIGTSLNGLARSARYDEAVLIAESRLAELAALRVLPASLEGTVDGSGHRWRIEPVAEPADPNEITGSALRRQRIKLTIGWQEDGRERTIMVERQLLLWRERP